MPDVRAGVRPLENTMAFVPFILCGVDLLSVSCPTESSAFEPRGVPVSVAEFGYGDFQKFIFFCSDRIPPPTTFKGSEKKIYLPV
jgi:hypothetical protein